MHPTETLIGFSRRAFASAIALYVLAACQNPSTPHQIVSLGGELPSPLQLPAVRGDANAVFDQLCRWATDHQQPFGPEITERVYVDQAVGSTQQDLSWDVLRVYLQDSSNPQSLWLRLDPRTPAYPSVHARAVYEQIDQPGLWLFEKVDGENCRSATPGYALAGDEEPVCVRVLHAEANPSQPTAVGAYHRLSFRMAQPPFSDQMIHIQVLTLRRETTIVGRSIQLRFRAGPLAIGALDKNCEPLIFPVAFETPQGS